MATLQTLDPKAVYVASSVVTYLIFKRYEPTGLSLPALLLGALPTTLGIALRNPSSSLPGAVLMALLIHWGLITLLTIGYRLSPLHPLAKYPGPMICKISKLWHAYVAARYGKAHIYVQELHKKYGDVVRIGPNELSITHGDVSSIVLGPKGLPRGPYYDTRRHDAGVSLDGLRDQALHTVRRRPWAKAMNSSSMKHYEDLLRNQILKLVGAFRKRQTDNVDVDISSWMTFFGFDFMGQMAFTYDFGMLTNGRDIHGLAHLIENALAESAWISHIPWIIPFLQYLPNASKSWDELKKVGEKTVEQRMNAGSSHPDLFHYLSDEEGVEAIKLTPDLVAVDGQLAIVAGSDTAATALSHLWYFLLANPKCLDRLQTEIREAFPMGEDINNFALQSTLLYLNACINEALRLYPPVLTGLQRRIASGTGGKTIGPHFVPDETQVSIWAYAVHRDPTHFSPAPNDFWPDRWLSQDKYVLPNGQVIPSEQVITNRDIFVPFSLGPMICVGKNVAMMEMRAVVCAVIQNFDIKMTDPSYLDKWEKDIYEIFITRRGTLPVRLEIRAV